MESGKLRLDVGGVMYKTTISTISNYPSMLATMIQKENEKRMIKEGKELFIDRDGRIFEYVLEYLRNGDSTALPEDEIAVRKLYSEADFFQLEGLIALIKKKIDAKFKLGDYVKMDMKMPKEEEIPEYKKKLLLNEENGKIEQIQAEKGLFMYEDLKRKIHFCGHQNHADLASIDAVKNLERIQRIFIGTKRHQWMGKIAAMRENCAIVEFFYGRVDSDGDLVKNGPLVLHVPQSILDKT